MGLDAGSPITAGLRGDGPTTVVFRGDFARPVRATLDGSPVAVVRIEQGIRVTVDLSGGEPRTLRIFQPG
jgi:hypothetical protein